MHEMIEHFLHSMTHRVIRYRFLTIMHFTLNKTARLSEFP